MMKLQMPKVPENLERIPIELLIPSESSSFGHIGALCMFPSIVEIFANFVVVMRFRCFTTKIARIEMK